MSDKVLLTELYPRIDKALSDKKNVDKIKTIVSKFVDRNADKLSTPGPSEMIIFSDRDIDAILSIIDSNQNEIKGMKKKSNAIKANGQTMKYPMNLAMPMIIRFFHLKKDIDMVKVCCTYLALSMYPVLFYKYWQYGLNQSIMAYTVNELSNKYKIKQTKNLLVALIETTIGAYDLKKKDLERGHDIDVVDFSLSVRTRLNSMLRYISKEYYKNHKEQNYMNLEKDDSSEDNYMESNSAVFQIDRLTNIVSTSLVISGPNYKLVTIAANNNRISVNELRNYINTLLINDNINQIKEMIENILYLYIYDEKNTIEEINSNKFLIYCLNVYKRSNTVNKNIIRIKEILDDWVEDLGTYRKTQNKSTINGFRRALLTFFVMSIQYVNKK